MKYTIELTNTRLHEFSGQNIEMFKITDDNGKTIHDLLTKEQAELLCTHYNNLGE